MNFLLCAVPLSLLWRVNHSVMSLCLFQDEHYEEDEGEEDGIVSSSFVRRSVELYDLPENEMMFLPSNMDSTQLSFKFKEVIERIKPKI